MAEMISLKSKTTGKVGQYPKSHLGMDDDLYPVDASGNICLPCMGTVPDPEAKTDTTDKQEVEVSKAVTETQGDSENPPRNKRNR